MVEVDIAPDELNAILKASFGGELSQSERQKLGFVVIKAKDKIETRLHRT